MRMLSALQLMVENEGRMVIRACEWFLRMRDEPEKKSKAPALKNRGQGTQIRLRVYRPATRQGSQCVKGLLPADKRSIRSPDRVSSKVNSCNLQLPPSLIASARKFPWRFRPCTGITISAFA
jgi:hypothetical protein